MKDQIYEVPLNIMEPPRIPLAPSSASKSVLNIGCGSWNNYGTVTLSIKAEKNFVFTGEKLAVSGEIDNTQRNVPIKEGFLIL